MSSKAYQEVYPFMTEEQKDIMHDLYMKAVNHDGHSWNMYCDIEDAVAGIVKEQIASTKLDVPDTNVGDMISRQAALDALPKKQKGIGGESWMKTYRRSGYNDCVEDCVKSLQALPPAQPDRDIPKKPNETTDRTWGIPKRQAVCPNCDSYLGVINFLSENGKTNVTYCESCGQAIDWKGWDFDE